MKKLISILLVAVMALSVFTLAVAAEDEAPVHTYSICTDADGNPLTGRISEEVAHGKAFTFENGELYLADDKDQGYLIFDNKLNANRVEATMVRDSENGLGAGDSGLVFCLKDTTNYNFWEQGVGFYVLFIDAGNKMYFARCGNLACGTADNPTKSWGPIGDRVAIDTTKYDIKKGITIAAEWDEEGNLKGYVNGDLIVSVKDPNGLFEGELYGIRMRQRTHTTDASKSSNFYFTSYVAGVKSETKTGDTTVIVSLIALVAAMGTGIVIGKKRHFN